SSSASGPRRARRISIPSRPCDTGKVARGMGAFIDNLRLALGTLVANPLRTLLTLLGIVIGVATVISMMALIEGLRMRVTSDMSALGANTFEVSKWPSGFGRVNWREIRKRPPITLDDLEAL